jgi:hypothetical protein
MAALLIILASAITVHYAQGASNQDRPPGVLAQDWIPVSDKLGFVMLRADPRGNASADDQPLLLTPAATGYFMARSQIGWQRLVIVEPLKGPGAAG